jgi:hypothetical protein
VSKVFAETHFLIKLLQLLISLGLDHLRLGELICRKGQPGQASLYVSSMSSKQKISLGFIMSANLFATINTVDAATPQLPA